MSLYRKQILYFAFDVRLFFVVSLRKLIFFVDESMWNIDG